MFILVLVFFVLFKNKLNATLLGNYQDEDVCYLSDIGSVDCYGEYDDSSLSYLNITDVANLEKDNNTSLNLIGFINIDKDINASTKYNKIITIGSKDNEDYPDSYFRGNNTNINGINKVILYSWGKASLGGFTFNNLSNLTLLKDNAEYSLDNIHFINTNNFTADINGHDIELRNIVFSMLGNSNLDLLINVSKYNTNITGNHIIINGDKTAKAKINISSNVLSSLKLQGIESSLLTYLKIKNNNLTIKNGIELTADNNVINISDSSINGNITLSNNNNNVTLNNVKFLSNQSIDFYKSNNTITIKNNFSGNINLKEDNNTLQFISANLDNSKIYLSKKSSLFFNNSSVGSNTTIKFTNGKDKNLNFSNTSYYGNLIFEDNSKATLIFKEGTNNYFGANLDIDQTSEADIKIEKNSKLKLKLTSNKAINSLNIYNNSTLELVNSSINVDQFYEEGKANININLEDNKDYIIHAKKTTFKNGSLFIDLSRSTLLKNTSNTITVNLLQSDNSIKDLNEIILSSNLFEYKVIHKDKKISITLKKTKDIVDLIKESYNRNYSVFYNSNLINIGNYLDKLWNKDAEVDTNNILDYLSNISSNSKEMLEYISSLFPTTNNTLNNVMHTNLFSFIDQINNNNNLFNNRVWYNSSFINTKVHFQKDGIITFNGKGFSLGKSSFINKDVSMFNGIDFTYSNSSSYNNDIDLFNIYGASALKICLKDNLCNINTVALGINYFLNNRYVVSNGNYYDSNKSNPLAINYLLNSSLKYNIEIFNNNLFNHKIIPLLTISLGKTKINSYSETGKQALQVNGFDKNFYRAEIGLSWLGSLKLKHAIIDSSVNLTLENNNNQIYETNYKFKNSSLDYTAKVKEELTSNNYLNLNFALGFKDLNNLVGAKLNLSYKANKNIASTVVSLSGFIKF